MTISELPFSSQVLVRRIVQQRLKGHEDDRILDVMLTEHEMRVILLSPNKARSEHVVRR